jgi:hypothetical protein
MVHTEAQVVVPGGASSSSFATGKEPAKEEFAEVDHEDGWAKHGQK